MKTRAGRVGTTPQNLVLTDAAQRMVHFNVQVCMHAMPQEARLMSAKSAHSKAQSSYNDDAGSDCTAKTAETGVRKEGYGPSTHHLQATRQRPLQHSVIT